MIASTTQRLMFAATLLAMSAAATAQQPPAAGDSPGDKGPRHHGPPPQVAIDACRNIAEGASCSFTGRRGDTISGICRTVPENAFACVPAHPPGQQGGEGQAPR